jgi:hypothetical protein
VLFPFDPALHDREDLGRQPVGFKRTFRLERRLSAGV